MTYAFRKQLQCIVLAGCLAAAGCGPRRSPSLENVVEAYSGPLPAQAVPGLRYTPVVVTAECRKPMRGILVGKSLGYSLSGDTRPPLSGVALPLGGILGGGIDLGKLFLDVLCGDGKVYRVRLEDSYYRLAPLDRELKLDKPVTLRPRDDPGETGVFRWVEQEGVNLRF